MKLLADFDKNRLFDFDKNRNFHRVVCSQLLWLFTCSLSSTLLFKKLVSVEKFYPSYNNVFEISHVMVSNDLFLCSVI